jgi:tetratricopeptide (TPR) repeat protein/protein involved in polysaccharide export with SLBB domain
MKKVLVYLCVLLVVCGPSLCISFGAPLLQKGGHAAAYHSEGAKLALQGRLQEAVDAFKRAIEVDPKNGNSYYSLGNVYSEMGRWGDAVAAYRMAVHLNDKDVEAYNGLGIALSRRGVYVQAAAAFKRAIKLYPKWAEPHYHLSESLRKLQQEAEAQAAYERALRLRPDYATRPPQPYVMNAVLKAETASREPKTEEDAPRGGDYAAAGSTSPLGATVGDNRARAADDNRRPGSESRVYYESGLRHRREGRHEEAVAAFRRAIILDRSNAEAHAALGDAYAELGRWRESVDAYEHATRLSGDSAEIYQKLGRAYVKLRETESAAAESGTSAAGEKRATAPADTTREAGQGGREATGLSAGTGTTATGGLNPTDVYRVGPGDVLDISVLSGSEQRTTAYKITPTGLLNFPGLAAPLQVAGLTTDEIEELLSRQTRGHASGSGLKTAVGVREYVSHPIIVSGMVKEPGTKILRREGVPLYVIIAHAQPQPGAGRAVVVSRATGQTTEVDLSDVRAMNMLVSTGDVITVQPRPEQYFYIAGAVRQPGQRKFHQGITLTQAILAAGGVTTSGTERVTIARQDSNGRLATMAYNLREIGAGRSTDPIIRPGDRIEVLR